MSTVIVSPTFEVIIPPEVRAALQLQAGETMRVMSYAGRVEFIPVRPIESMRGYLRGIDTTIDRDEDRR